MKKLLKKKKILIILSILIIALAGLLIGYYIIDKKEEPLTTKENIEKSEETVQIVDIDSTTRPFAVMINNHSEIRPYHSGLQDAYIIYEIVVEGGISRYLALFKDVDTARIAGIRSSRHYYLDYAMENDAYYIHWGGSPQAYGDLNTLNIDSFEVGANYYAFRDSSLPVATEHQTYSSIADLNSAISTKGYRAETNLPLLFTYSAESLDLAANAESLTANNIEIYYSSANISSFTYNEDTKTYDHSVNGSAHNDYITSNQYTFKNIITYQVTNYTIPGDTSGRQTLENIGSGTGYYISEGTSIPINWSKDSRESQTIYTLSDGSELKINDGNTYIAIQPSGQSLIME